MRPHFDPLASAHTIGQKVAKNAAKELATICCDEMLRIQNTNAPIVLTLTLLLESLYRELQELRAKLHLICPSPRTLVNRRRYHACIATLFTIAGLLSSHFALAPFGIGWEIWIFSSALALTGAFWTDVVLQRYHAKCAVEIMFVAAFVASIAGLLALASLRGDIVLFLVRNAMDAANQSPDAPAMNPADAAKFYTAAAHKLQWFFTLLTIAMELGAGLAIFDVRNANVSSLAEAEKITKRIAEIESEMISLAGRRAVLQSEPAVFEAEFRRNAHAGLIDIAEQHDLGSIGRFVAIIVVGIALIRTGDAQRLHVVEGVDFSKSEIDKTNPRSPHSQDIEAATRVILRLPPGANVDAFAITDQSFARPISLLTGQIPIDHGPLTFIDQIQVARNRLMKQLRTESLSLNPDFQQTDVVGFLVFVGHIMRSRDGRHVLIIFSDMRNCTRDLDIETPALVPVSAAMQIAKRRNLIADLKGLDVFVLGVYAGGKSIQYATTLEQFWRAYFVAAGANLRNFSVLRDPPVLSHIVPKGDHP